MTAVELPADEAAQVRERIARLGIPGVVDVHTHFMPQRVLDKVWAYFDAAGPLTGRPWPIAYRTSLDERVETLRSFGVLRYGSLCYPHKPGMAAWLNAWCRDFADAHPDCLRSATFYPEPDATEYVAAAAAAGVAVFKAHVQVGDYDLADPLLDGVWSVLEESGTPIVLHAGDGPAPGRFTGPAGVRDLLRRHPDLALVIAHLGLPDYADFLDLCAAHPRVHLDTTMAFTPFTEEATPFPPELLPRLVELGDRIVFGSDFPNIPYPYLTAVDSILDLGLGEDWAAGVLYRNGARLFGSSPES